MMKTLEEIVFEIFCAETNRQVLCIPLSLSDPYSPDYARLYKKWQYYDDLIAHLKHQHKRSLLEQMLKLSLDTSAR